MSEEHMDFLLSTVTDFEEMNGKGFTAKKCDTMCPRIAALKESFGFGPEEPLKAENLHYIIPSTKNIRLILNKKKKSTTPMPKIQPAKVPALQNHFRPGSSRMSSVNSRVHTPKITSGVNSRSSTPKSATNSIQKVSGSHDMVGAILRQASSTTSRFSTPNIAKRSIVKVTAPRNLHSRILEHDSSQTTNGTFRPTANRTSTGIQYHLPAPNIKDSSPVKDKEHSSKTSDGDLTSSQESGVSVSTIDTVIMEEKENEISDLIF